MSLFNLFKKASVKNESKKEPVHTPQSLKNNEKIATRKGELGEYKIDIQLAQLPKEYRYISDLLVPNPKATSGYSQIDHVVITPYGIFVIETKNYQGTIYGGKKRRTWLVNGQFKMMNPFDQNYGHIQALKNWLSEIDHNLFISMVSFTKRCTFKVDLDYRKILSNELIVYDIELSEFIHRKVSVLSIQNQNPLINQDDIIRLYNTLAEANVTDPKIREHHKQALKDHKQELSSPKPKNATKTSPICVVCKQPVSKKVEAYCLAIKKFKGNIYCFEHQKSR